MQLERFVHPWNNVVDTLKEPEPGHVSAQLLVGQLSSAQSPPSWQLEAGAR